MDKKKIISLIAAGAMMVGITVSLGTGAWFTDNKTSNTSFKAGTLKLGEPGTITSGMSLGNIYPGWAESKTVTINNAGSLPLKYKLSMSPLTGNVLFDGQTPLQVDVNNQGYVDINKLGEVFLGQIAARSNGTFDIAFKLPGAAGNDYANKTAIFDFNFTAAQINDTSFRVNNNPTTVNVKTGNVDNILSFNSIQSAVNAVAPGGIVNIAAGTYVEQVNINGKDITINGETKNGSRLVTIQSPALLSTLFTTSSAAKPIIAVKNTNNFNINNIIVDGNMQGQANYRFMGIGLYNVGGSIKNCEIKNIIEASYNGMQHGVGIYAYNTDGISRTLNVDSNVIYNYNKGGIVVNGEKLTGNVTNNTVTGQGVPNINGQNGIQFGYGATGSVVGNTVTKNIYDTQTSAGILLYEAVNMKSVDEIQADNLGVIDNDINVWVEK